MSTPSLESFVAALTAMYNADSNDTRRMHTQDVMQQEAAMSSEDVLRVGVGLLRVEDCGAAVQAYGAFLLRRAVSSGLLNASAVPYESLLPWYLEEPSLSRPLAAALIELLVECVVRVWPDAWPGLFPALCPPGAQLARHARKLLLLRALVEAVAEPVGRVPPPRMRPTRAAIAAGGRALMVEATQALYELYTAAANGADSVPQKLVSAALAILVAVGPLVPVAQWWDVGVGTTLAVLVQWAPAAPDALSAAAALLRCEALPTAAAAAAAEGNAVGSELSALVTAALAGTEQAAAQRNWPAIDAAAELLRDMPEVIVRDEAAVAAVSRACVVLLGLPSVLFAHGVCTVLLRLGVDGLAHVDVAVLLSLIARLVLRNRLHPLHGSDPEGRALAEQQYGTAQHFEEAFAELRGAAGRLLTNAAVAAPEKSNFFVLSLLSDLNSDGTPEDPRTPAGYVTQKSVTFEEWEATQFVVVHLAEGFRRSSAYVPQAVAALVSRQPRDMVLCPVFLNMLAAFWQCGDDDALGVWEGSFTILFACVERRDLSPADPNDVAARKRALTLLVTACSDHAARFLPLCSALLRRLEQLRVCASTTVAEKALLYEAIAALTAALPQDEAEVQLRALLDPIISLVKGIAEHADQSHFNRVITGCSPGQPGSQGTLRSSLAVIAGVTRRRRTSPYVLEAVTKMVPLIARLMELAHGVRADDLPEAFRGIAEMDHAVREQFLPGRRRQSDLRVNEPQRARHALADIRLALYQIVATFSHLMPDTVLEGMLGMLAAAMDTMPVHAVRQLTGQCLFPMAAARLVVLPQVLNCIGAFFDYRAQNSRHTLAKAQYNRHDKGATQKCEDDDVVEMRQLFPLTKDLFAFMRKHIIDTSRGDLNPAMKELGVRVALAVVRSGANVVDGAQMVFALIGNSADQFDLAVFGQLVDFAKEASDIVLPARFRDRFVTLLADTYIARFPAFADALRERFAPDIVDELHAYISMTTRADMRRIRFKEIILKSKRIYE